MYIDGLIGCSEPILLQKIWTVTVKVKGNLSWKTIEIFGSRSMSHSIPTVEYGITRYSLKNEIKVNLFSFQVFPKNHHFFIAQIILILFQCITNFSLIWFDIEMNEGLEDKVIKRIILEKVSGIFPKILLNNS